MQTAAARKPVRQKPVKAPLGKRLLKYWPLYLMLLPCIIYYILICYVPMAGSVLAFKDYSFRKGIDPERFFCHTLIQSPGILCFCSCIFEGKLLYWN